MIRLVALLLALAIGSPAEAVPLAVKRRLYPSVGSASSAPSSWYNSTNTKGVWLMEESSGNRANQTTGGPTLSDAGTTPTTTAAGSVMQGTRALDPGAGTSEYLTWTDSGTTLDHSSGGNAFGAWVATDATGNLRRIIEKGTSTTTAVSDGYMLGRATGNANIQCNWDSTVVSGVNNSLPASTNLHVACRKDGTNGRAFLNGHPSGTATAASAPGDNGNPFRVGSRSSAATASQQWDGRIDEVFYIATNPSDAQMCRIARCGFDGTYCACDGSTGYKTCITDADCQVHSPNGVCDRGSASNSTYGTCAGRMYGICNGGANVNLPCTSANESSDCPSSYCKLCTPVACDNAGP